ncbi:hypothetical protein LXH21_03635 [Flavobacterium algicola]|nr:hypothetical protein [Flavobacterium algicola]
MINPFGFLIAAILLISPVWIAYDVATKKETLLSCYKKTEYYIRQPKYGIPLLLIVIFNWIWNIAKGL